MRYLATDLDGTLIPNSNKKSVTEALNKFHLIRKEDLDFSLIFISGRDLKLVEEAIGKYNLPIPDFIISDVGSAVYIKKNSCWELCESYRSELNNILKGEVKSNITNWLESLDGIELQESYRQGEFKSSFYIDDDLLTSIIDDLKIKIDTEDLPYEIIVSHEPITGRGLLDILPKGVSKEFALKWFLKEYSNNNDRVVFAGDSGNDLNLFLSGIDSIVVSNTPDNIKDRVDMWIKEDEKRKRADSIFFATDESTAGVLQGCFHFGIL